MYSTDVNLKLRQKVRAHYVLTSTVANSARICFEFIKNVVSLVIVDLQQRLRWSRGKRVGLWYPSSRVQTRLKPSDFSGEKIPQHAFLRRGSKTVGHMS
jgi:hypothetical protein